MKKTALVLSLALVVLHANATVAECTEKAITNTIESYIDNHPEPKGRCANAKYTVKILKYSISLVEENCGRNSQLTPMVESWRQCLAESEELALDTCVD